MMSNVVRRSIILVFCIIIMVGVILLVLSDNGSGLNTQTARNTISQNHVSDTGAQNAVSAIYLNYRLWDTLFEALVLLVSAVAVISFSRSPDDEG